MLGEISNLNRYKTISISPENLDGAKGKGGAIPLELGTSRDAARDLGTGWKVNPRMFIEAGAVLTLADVADQGEIRHIWLTPTGVWRGQILRIYWDGSDIPAVECPLGDFFANGLNEYAPVVSVPVCVNPGSAFNCYWRMPFRKGFRITLENRNENQVCVYYQITYVRKPVSENAGYFHAQFRRENPLPYMKDFVMLDGIKGAGQYVGTYMTWGVHNNLWWGEGEVKIFIDGDTEYPSICYTGTEDYFCGSYDFENQKTHQYEEFVTPYCGLPQVIRPDTLYRPQMRFGMYRWHITDPIYFSEDIRVTIQALGWRSVGRYLPLQDDISCVAYFYIDKPSCALPKLGTPDDLEII
ncbi:MAG: DUF2961 domain-containing protein [Oscillospiraceae bacterium]|jgi:hypothetical protein|nr:DUF2961 domain-containing protein [Oscillospiraceae bacterium]